MLRSLAVAGLVISNALAQEGVVPLFDGKSLAGWDGDPTHWRVENGCIVGEVTPETLLKRNSFLIWRGGTVDDFELVVEYRVSAQGNSGVNYRSIETPGLRWSLTGYQGDIEGGPRWTGQNYEERGRTFLAYRGQSVVLRPGAQPEVARQIASADALQAKVKQQDWNTYRIVAVGPRIQHFINGALMCEVEDLDPGKRRLSGLLGVQVHVGPPMKIEYRSIGLKRLEPAPGVRDKKVKAPPEKAATVSPSGPVGARFDFARIFAGARFGVAGREPAG